MPISGPSTYLPTIAAFLAHWEEVNEALPPAAPLLVAPAVARADLEAARDGLEEQRDAVTDGAVDRTVARQQLDLQIAALQARMVEFNARIRADLPGSAWERSLPLAFAIGDGEAAVREGLRQISRLWEKINALSPAPAGVTLPLLLQEGLTRLAFDALRTALRDAYRALTDAEVDLKLAREQRNDSQDYIYGVLKGYRLKVAASFPDTSALVESLPALTPPTGRTPEAVAATAVWDAAEAKAKVTWEASEDEALASYQVRGAPGDEYETADEVVLATFAPGDAREFFSLFALGSPGLTAGFKVYVVLSTGHERGSEPAYVTRP